MMLIPFIELLCLAGVAAQCSFRGNWSHFGGHCYHVSGQSEIKTYNEAEVDCIRLGAKLVSVTSPMETIMLVNKVNDCQQSGTCAWKYNKNHFWIGLRKAFPLQNRPHPLTQRRAGWTWLSGELYSWQNWLGTYPMNYTGYVRMYIGKWIDASPNETYRYICERTADDNQPASGIFNPSPPTVSVAASDAEVTVISSFSTASSDITYRNATVIDPETIKYVYIGVSIGLVLIVVISVIVFYLLGKGSLFLKTESVSDLYDYTEHDKSSDLENQETSKEDTPYGDIANDEEEIIQGVNYDDEDDDIDINVINPAPEMINSGQMDINAAPPSSDEDELSAISQKEVDDFESNSQTDGGSVSDMNVPHTINDNFILRSPDKMNSASVQNNATIADNYGNHQNPISQNIHRDVQDDDGVIPDTNKLQSVNDNVMFRAPSSSITPPDNAGAEDGDGSDLHSASQKPSLREDVNAGYDDTEMDSSLDASTSSSTGQLIYRL